MIKSLNYIMAIRTQIVALLVVSFAAIAFAEEELYTDKYDSLDIDAVLANDRLRKQYYNCFMDIGPCVTPDAIFFKDKFPEAIVTKCRKCTKKQKEGFEKVVIWFTTNAPDDWDAVIRKAVAEFQAKGATKKSTPAS